MKTLSREKSAPVGGALSAAARCILGYRSAKILLTAVNLGLFEQFRKGPRTSRQLASALNLNQRACTVFLDALTAMEFLAKGPEGYSLSEEVAAVVWTDGPQSLHHNLRYQAALWNAWSHLPDVLRTGAPTAELRSLLNNPNFTKDYILGMREISRRPAQVVAEFLLSKNPQTILDVGAGPGMYSLAMLRQSPKLRATLLDLPSTLDVTRTLVGQWRKRITFLPGDYHTSDFGRDAYDLILLSNITHDEGPIENQRLIQKSFRALHRGGRIAIHDFTLNEDRSGPLFGAMFAVHMMVCTGRGQTYRERDYQSWLEQTGFKNIETHPICPQAENASTLMIGTKL